jgi:hypothetical protein
MPFPATLPADAHGRVVQAVAEIFENPPERRSNERRPFFGPVTLAHESNCHVCVSAFAKDVSSLGIGLVHIMPLDPGALIARIELPSGESISFRVQIEWCKDYGDGWYASGGRLLDLVETRDR